jgi:hypothetical protein
VTLSHRVLGEWRDLDGPQSVIVKPMFEGGLVTADREALLNFQMQASRLYRAVTAAIEATGEVQGRIDHLLVAVKETPGAIESQAQAVRDLRSRLQDIDTALNGDSTISSRNEPSPLAIASRVSTIVDGSWESQSGVTGNFRDSYAVADQQFREVIADLKAVDSDLRALEVELEAEGAPWTPGRIPDWP